MDLERGGRTRAASEAQRLTLIRLCADVTVLTELGPSFTMKEGCVTSPPERPGHDPEAWVAIVGEYVEPVSLEIPYARMAAAARVTVEGRSVIVYGSVLPWLKVTTDAPEIVLAGEDSFATFRRVLAEQAADVQALRSHRL